MVLLRPGHLAPVAQADGQLCLRWEIYNPQTVTSAGNGGWLQLDTGEMKVAGVNGVPLNGDVQNSFKNLAPRVGFAYQINSKTVARVGYGRTFDVGTFGSIFGHSVTQNLPVLGVQASTHPTHGKASSTCLSDRPLLNPATVLNSQPTGARWKSPLSQRRCAPGSIHKGCVYPPSTPGMPPSSIS